MRHDPPATQRTLRVLHVTTAGRIGGAERMLIDVAAASRRLGLCELSVVVLGPGHDLQRELEQLGIPVVALGVRTPLEIVPATVRLTALIRRTRPDVVHAHLIHGAAVGLLAARLGTARLAVMTRHYERFVWMYGTRLDRTLHRIGHRLAQHIFAISEAARTVLVATEGIEARRVSVVHNGIDVDRVHRLGTTDGTPEWPRDGRLTIGTLGSLELRKGHEDLVRAVARMRARARVRLVIIGEGPERSKLAGIAAAEGLSDQVVLLGYRPAPYPLLRAFDIYVQPSREEGFGLAVLEAMALKRPVVATAVGGLPEIVRSTDVGILCPSRDTDALAAALDRLAHDAALRRRLGAAASLFVRMSFSADETAIKYARVYNELLWSPTATA